MCQEILFKVRNQVAVIFCLKPIELYILICTKKLEKLLNKCKKEFIHNTFIIATMLK